MMPFRWWFRRLERRAGKRATGDLDCRGVMRRLYEYIDEELDAETVEKIREHLELCKKCYPHYEFEKAFLRLVGYRRRASAPPDLRQRVLHAIVETEHEG